jgi:hypothetical protein
MLYHFNISVVYCALLPLNVKIYKLGHRIRLNRINKYAVYLLPERRRSEKLPAEQSVTEISLTAGKVIH